MLAAGVSGKPNVPTFPGQDVFRGEQHHSSQHPGPDDYKDKQVVVVGSNNSAFDICGALWEVGADVTMVQRSSTHIVKSDSLMDIALGDLYSERALAAGVTTFKADTIFASLPYRILHELQIPVYAAIKERDQDFYDRLEASGFRHDWGEDGSGLFMKYLRRGSGYYIDVGVGELVANGDVPVKHGQVTELTENGVMLDAGEELPADLVVYATGYGSMNGLAADIDRAGDGRQGRQGVGPGLGHHQGPRARGRASSATCGSPPSRRGCGSTAATCTSRATTRSTSRCSSRRAPRASRRRSTRSRRSTTRRDHPGGDAATTSGRPGGILVGPRWSEQSSGHDDDHRACSSPTSTSLAIRQSLQAGFFHWAMVLPVPASVATIALPVGAVQGITQGALLGLFMVLVGVAAWRMTDEEWVTGLRRPLNP